VVKKVVRGLAVFAIGVAALRAVAIWSASQGPAREIGKYRIVETRGADATSWFSCRPRQSIYFEGQHLGTCGLPGGGDRQTIPNTGCIVVAADASSAVYWHDPQVCGNGSIATDKTHGIYLHNAQGERLLYKYPAITGTSARAEGDGMQLGWGPLPVGEDQRCRPALVLGADGVERAIKPSDPRCR
jgi:hypothetical protein